MIEDFTPGYLAGIGLGYEDLSRANPAIVVTSVTPFRQTGPHALWQGSDLIAQSMADWMFNVGDEGDLPCAAPGDPTTSIGGVHGAFGTLMALYARRASGLGQHVDVSLQEAMIASSSSMPVGRFSAATEIMRRMGSDTNTAGVNCYPCSDGYAQMNIHFAHLWKRLVEWIQNPVLEDPYWLTMEARHQNAEVADEFVKEFALTMTKEEFVRGGRERSLPVAPVSTFSDVSRSEQLAARRVVQGPAASGDGERAHAGIPVGFAQHAAPVRALRSAAGRASGGDSERGRGASVISGRRFPTTPALGVLRWKESASSISRGRGRGRSAPGCLRTTARRSSRLSRGCSTRSVRGERARIRSSTATSAASRSTCITSKGRS